MTKSPTKTVNWIFALGLLGAGLVLGLANCVAEVGDSEGEGQAVTAGDLANGDDPATDESAEALGGAGGAGGGSGCSDGVENGTETDVDCGGGACPTCGTGKGCTVASDCESAKCSGGVCLAPTCTDTIKNGTETSIDCGGSCATKCLIGKTCSINADCYAGNCYIGVCMPSGWKCGDGVKNGTETAIDCGGTNCVARCADGKTCLLGSDCTNGVCTNGICGAALPSCSDAIKNGTETDIDCGGSCATKCANGKTCSVNADCSSTLCSAGVCAAPPSCSDAIKNGTETDIDCGGSCAAKCANGKTCSVNADCSSTLCSGGVCAAPPSCSDAIKNGTETDIDCGGTCATKCANGKTCSVNADCSSSNCSGGVCAAPLPTCTDAVKNGTETDIDCGGTCATKCANGKTCSVNGDCASTLCSGGVCTALPTCFDAIKNGTETDIDCGGTCATKCANGKLCAANADCSSGNCSGGVCAAPLPTCTDAVKNGTETDIDCGGTCATKCANGKTCSVNADCSSTLCSGGVCAALPSCFDAIKNGTETDIDCGGSCAADCANGKLCSANADCSSGNCSGGVCAAPSGSCSDGIKNGTETAIDCGGSCATKCLIGKTCSINADCYAGNCYLGVCMPLEWKCTDAVKNGTETDVDCGGSNCAANCADGKACAVAADCVSGACNGGICGGAVASCSDAIKNGTETDVDCGGSCAADCANGKTCAVNADCLSSNCSGGVCAALPTCSDAIKNGTETDIDCGGTCAADCANGKLCAVNADCQSAFCDGGVCAAPAPTCSDALKNGSETDVDCGGIVCVACSNGKTCSVNADCSSGNCSGGVCAAPLPTCTDAVKNGTETDVDCGGSCAADCANGKTCAVNADCLSSNCSGGVCAALPTCSDAIKNGTETDIDCGGTCAADCANGKLCAVNADCQSAFCDGGVCAAPAPTCSDALKNGSETDVDCGGIVCVACSNGKTCSVNADCSSGNCSGGVCAAPLPTCTDAVKNGTETDVDCGGTCATKCANGKTCSVNADCSSTLCSGGVCAALPTCFDAIKNGTETDIDCGGTCAADCANGKLCAVNADCSSGNCSGGVCAAPLPTCTDAVKNGTETDVDCGGTCATKCANGKTCSVNADCSSTLCSGGVCAALPTCFDAIKNGTETDIDCGGTCAADCANGKLCAVNADCSSGNCSGGVCAAPLPTCTDAVKNGTETDIDCGGTCAAKCANGKTCSVNADCSSTLCSGGVCAALPTCTDAIKNGTETDIDCGGTCAAKCANGKTCSVNADCSSALCSGGVCAAPAGSCSDGIKNGTETAIDCGGSCATKCLIGKTCSINADCYAGNCYLGVCMPLEWKCTDAVKNGTETDVDCGGSNCTANCANGKTCAVNADCVSGACTGGICGGAVASCSDAIKNGTETDVDCGGTCAAKCANGKLCAVNADCSSTLCSGGVCAALPSCFDAIKNGTETDIDCGGTCAADCANGKTCAVNADCLSSNCSGGVCAALPTCSDAIKNGTETDIDCGGTCAADCANGKLCAVNADCQSAFCDGGVCAAPAPTCSDALKNGSETDVDCGGIVCVACSNGKTCSVNADCSSGNCSGGVCAAPLPTCTDAVKNGTETDIDCGGTCATKCANGKTCSVNADCSSTLCSGGVCAALPTCFDAIKNGTETDIDCGGTCAADCANGKLCAVNADCQSAFCDGGVCAAPAPSCTDAIKNGSESDVDCGGIVCVACGNGKACGANSDCSSGNCSGGFCAAAPVGCNDGIKNGSETDVDCGGGTCPLCANGKTCGSLVDCASASCASGVCAAIVPTCTDGVKNGAETDVDCGGGTCGKCANGKTCSGNGDCQSAGCVGGVCSVVAATCSDGLKNGSETDVDCGGASCPKCAISKTCASATDCALVGGFAQCQNNICIVPNAPCGNAVKDGSETDVDCGGSQCGKCQNGWFCSVGTDCKSGACSGGVCVAANPTCADGIKNGGETDTDCGGPVCAKCAGGQTCSNVGDCLSGSCVLNACGGGVFANYWSKRYGGATDQECDVVRTDASENVFLANYAQGLVDYGLGNVGNGEQIAMVKLSPAGTALWSKSYRDGTKQYPYGLGVSSTGALFLAGGYQFTLKFGAPAANMTALGTDDLYTASFGNTGATLWAKSFGDASQFQQFNGTAIDLQGNPVMTGWLTGNANFGGGNLNGNNVDIVVVKLDKTGSHLWSKVYGNGGLQGGHSVAVDASGNVIVVGYMNGSVNFGGGAVGPAGSSIFLLKLDANGNHVWSKAFPSTQNELHHHAVAVDAAGNIFIGGGKLGTINFGGGNLVNASSSTYDAYLAKYDANGNHVWSKNYGDSQHQWVDDVAVDASGNLIATGSFLGAINFGGGSLSSSGGTEFGGDVFVAKLNTAGSQVFAGRYGDASRQEPKSVTVDASGNVLVCGLFAGSINFGSGNLTSAGGNDIFVAKMRLP
jgi:hypothetical protein